MTDIDGVQLINRVWPPDGPYTAESLISAGQAIAELFRYLARATIRTHSEALRDTTDIYPIFATLATATHSNHQVLRQLGTWAEHTAGFDTTIRHDEAPQDRDGHHAAVALLEAAKCLDSAAQSASRMGTDLSGASVRIAHIFYGDR